MSQIWFCFLELDLFKMEQVFSNILANALEAINRGGQIGIQLQQCGNEQILIEFWDSGVGFDQESIDKVFDPYFTTKENGTGLGLSISYQALMAHGAKIEVSNRYKGGAQVQIFFPMTLTGVKS